MLGTLRAVSGARARSSRSTAIEQLVAGIAAAHEMHAERRRCEPGLSGDGERRRRSPTSRSTSRPTCSAAERVGPHADAGDGRRGLLVRAAAAAGRARVPRRVPARRAAGACARLPLEPHDDRRRRHAAPASRCTRRWRSRTSPARDRRATARPSNLVDFQGG